MALQSPLSLIVLDEIERLLEYVSIGPRFSNAVLQTLLVLLKKNPPEGRRLFVIGTTSLGHVMQEMDVAATFNVALHVPCLTKEEMKSVLGQLGAFSGQDVSCCSLIGFGACLRVVDWGSLTLGCVDCLAAGGCGPGGSGWHAHQAVAAAARLGEARAA